MIDVAVYIQGARVELFKFESIPMQMSVKNISDISKLKTDFTQTFTLPAQGINNVIFSHWYNADVDGTFDANVRVPAYIEINTLPFKYGSIQLMGVQMKYGEPYSYSITFFSAAVNLSDLFSDESLKDLDLSEFDHVHNIDVVKAMYNFDLSQGEIYYPLISAVGILELGTGGPRDLYNEDNEISYTEFKPALRDIHIIEAIEARYGVTFSRDFLGRALFHNKFTWLHRDAGPIKAFGQLVKVDITSAGSLGDIDVDVDTVNDTISYTHITGELLRVTRFKVTPEAGYEEIPYKVFIFNFGVQVASEEFTGTGTIAYDDGGDIPNLLSFYVSGSSNFEFKTRILVKVKNVPIVGHIDKATNTPVQLSEGYVAISQQIPDIKVKDYINSLIAQFNLVLIPTTESNFYVDTLDSWYDKGRLWDITNLVDIKEVGVKRVDVKKQIDFVYQETGSILGEAYRINNGVGYGDLKAKFENVAGTDLKIESKYENMLFSRLTNKETGELTDIQAGLSIDSKLAPYKGKPVSFYRAGMIKVEFAHVLYISGETLFKLHHTATEDNIELTQVTSSLNFGADQSSYFYSAIERSLYGNFWSTFIADLYNPKSRILSLKGRLPVRILQDLKLNDRFKIKDRKYKISVNNVDLVSGNATIEIFTDHSAPFDSIAEVTPLTVDSTEYTVDSELLTVDMISTYSPSISYIVNSISRTVYQATCSQEFFELAISASSNWTVTKINNGFGTSWVSVNNSNGFRSGFVRVQIDRQPVSDNRSVILRFTIGADTFDCLINQDKNITFP